ncbi:hypothetical protein B4V02_12575 [Paenibacillus kribbensis]|uniref:Uncharacterized protein n=1 Tax=Paenibacillus kribbensis TaxID=172713 RepID=A0A222WTJ9_9BACL|nr:hypothetical protein [Paenibacillus kribbensis]ASR49940.1 hypothetical protein B4V02_12575 [Paenibacillus kribbensis]
MFAKPIIDVLVGVKTPRTCL